MSPLPRPVKDALAEPETDASVMRVWGKIQVQRRVPPPLVRPWLVLGAALALTAFVVLVWPSTKPVVNVPVAAAAAISPEVTLRRVWRAAQGDRVPLVPRPTRSTVSEPGVAAAPDDVVGALLMSVEDAAREGRTEQVVAILGEIGAHHATDPRAAEALFMLGSLQLEVLNQPHRAVESFRRGLELNPADDLVPQMWAQYEAARLAAHPTQD